MTSGPESITPFEIPVDRTVLEDLAERLGRTRWPRPEPVGDWSQGAPLAFVQEICAYWETEYDWVERSALLSAFPHFMTEIDGVDIHFIHAESPHADALPLIMTHGWPGSVVEFQKVLGPLTDPTAHGGSADQAFHVVCPSLPGYGFSGAPSETGWGVERIADTWRTLMGRLGYERFGAQGGDWGAMVTTALGQRHTDAVAGIHLNMAVCAPTADDPTEQELAALAGLDHYQSEDSGYSKQQSTRPQSLGYGLADSPSGQAAWILEKFWAWTDNDGSPTDVLTPDELLDNVMMYWLNNAGASSARLYWESFDTPDLGPVEVPTGVALFPKEIFQTSERWAAARFSDLRQFTEMDRGGHFAAFEQPGLLVDDVRSFFALVR